MRFHITERPTLSPTVRVFRWLFVLGILYQTTLLFRPDEAFLSRPYIEDAFYTLSVSRSIARGTGISIDGVHPTNGFQPLIALMNVPCFMASGGNDILALRLTVLLQIVIYALAALSLGWLVTTCLRAREDRTKMFWGSAVLVVWNYSLSIQMLNGLETGLSVALVCTALAYYNGRIAGYRNPPLARFAMLGVLLGVGVLSRIDVSILVAALLSWHLLRSDWSGRRNGTAFDVLRSLLECAVAGGVAACVSAPWWIYNHIVFGSIMPISGQALLTTPIIRGPYFSKLAQVVSNHLLFIVHITFPVDGVHATIFAGAFIFVGVLLLGLVTRTGRSALLDGLRNWTRVWNPTSIVPLYLFSIPLTIFYTFYFHAPHFLPRYLVPLGLAIQITLLSLLYTIYRTRAIRTFHSWLAAVGVCVWVVASGVLFARNFTMSIEDGNVLMAPAHWIARHTTPADNVGMFQSGTTGFLFGNVVNLDGKVNVGALRALQRGAIASYIDSAKFDYIIDWPHLIVQFGVTDYIRSRYVPVDTLGYEFVVWRRVGEQHYSRP